MWIESFTQLGFVNFEKVITILTNPDVNHIYVDIEGSKSIQMVNMPTIHQLIKASDIFTKEERKKLVYDEDPEHVILRTFMSILIACLKKDSGERKFITREKLKELFFEKLKELIKSSTTG